MKLIIISTLAMVCLAEPPVNRYLPPQQRGPPSTLYGVPNQRQTDAVFRGQPSNQYGPPQTSSHSGLPSSQYGAPQGISSQYGGPAPSSQYGTPEFSGSDDFSRGSHAQSREYLPPGAGGRGGYDDGSNGEPANYNFEYMVMDEQSGNDFGHRESRQGDRAEGLYYVLLPDGRKQTVEYEADQGGYRPKISYEDTGLTRGAYGRNNNNGFNGY